MRRLASALALVVVGGLRLAAADPVAVKVTEVAGDVAYLSPGRAAGLVPGTKLKIRGVDFVVAEVTEQTASVRLDTVRLATGDAGTAEVTPGAVTATRTLARPRPAEAFAGQWPEPVMPSTVQDVAAVPLGSGRTPGRVHVTVIGHAFGAIDRSSQAASAEARVIGSVGLLNERPLAADVDVAVRGFSEGANKQTRTPLFVRTAQLRYGDAYDPQLALGRLRYAASSLGMLDGARAALHRGNLEVAAFGGIVPDPLSGKPDTGASRFGGELIYDLAQVAWQPRVAVTAHASTWDGTLDERRLSVNASANRDHAWFDGWAEAQSFPSGNPWGAAAVELTGAGATAEWRKRGRHLGVDLTFLRPERSLRLAAALPPEWLCTLAPQPGAAMETCGSAGDWWASATGSAGVRTSRWAVDAVGSIGDSHGVYRGVDSSGYVRGELRLGTTTRLEAGASGGYASFAQWMAGELGVGYAPTRRLDGAIRYRPELFNFNAGTGPIQLHSIVADGRYAMSTMLDLGVSMVGTVGAEREALAVLAIVAWRPLP